MRKLGIGVLGVGEMGKRHAENLRRLVPEGRLVGLADRSAVRAGKDVLCEKPLALNLSDARSAIDAVAKAGRRLQVGFMRRYDPAYAAAMKRIEAGEIGVPVIFKSLGRDKEWAP